MESNKRRRATVAFFTTTGLMFAAMVYYIARGTVDPAFYWAWKVPQRPTAAASAEHDDRVTMQVDERVRIGRSALVYRGIDRGVLHIDHYLLDFNPRYPYPHKIPIKTAKREFQIGRHLLRLLAQDRGRIRILHVASRQGG